MRRDACCCLEGLSAHEYPTAQSGLLLDPAGRCHSAGQYIGSQLKMMRQKKFEFEKDAAMQHYDSSISLALRFEQSSEQIKQHPALHEGPLGYFIGSSVRFNVL